MNYTTEQLIKLAEYLGEKVIKVEWRGKVYLIYDSEIEYIEEIKPFVLDWNIIKRLELKMKNELGCNSFLSVQIINHHEMIYYCQNDLISTGVDEQHAILNAVLQHIGGKA
jgi:hypothetical protein